MTESRRRYAPLDIRAAVRGLRAHEQPGGELTPAEIAAWLADGQPSHRGRLIRRQQIAAALEGANPERLEAALRQAWAGRVMAARLQGWKARRRWLQHELTLVRSRLEADMHELAPLAAHAFAEACRLVRASTPASGRPAQGRAEAEALLAEAGLSKRARRLVLAIIGQK